MYVFVEFDSDIYKRNTAIFCCFRGGFGGGCSVLLLSRPPECIVGNVKMCRVSALISFSTICLHCAFISHCACCCPPTRSKVYSNLFLGSTREGGGDKCCAVQDLEGLRGGRPVNICWFLVRISTTAEQITRNRYIPLLFSDVRGQ